MDINSLKEIFRDDRLHIGIGLIKKLHLAEDRSYLKVTLEVFPESRNIIATMTWENVGPDSGDFEFPSTDDLVLFAQAEGDEDHAFIIKRLSSKEDTIPEEAISGDKVQKAKAGKKYWNISDTKFMIAREGVEPVENLVLGQVFKQFASDLLVILKDHATIDSTHDHIGNFGYLTTVPSQQTDYTDTADLYNDLKDSPINDELILSDLAFTEK